jgi:hypothetical protein
LSVSDRQSPQQSATVRQVGDDVTQITFQAPLAGTRASDGNKSRDHGGKIADVFPAIFAVFTGALPNPAL